jgi:O-antigen ligase
MVKKTAPPISISTPISLWRDVLVFAIGLWLGISLVKLGNPVVLDGYVGSSGTVNLTLANPLADQAAEPSSVAPGYSDPITEPWPMKNGVIGLALLIVPALFLGKVQRRFPWGIAGLLLFWFFWQLVAASRSLDPLVSKITLIHFLVCVVCFFLGAFVISESTRPELLWYGLTAGYLMVLWVGLGQHYGGLEAVKKAVYETPNWDKLPKEFLKRVNGGRIFSTLVYPNALAGAILLFAAPVTAFLWQVASRTKPVVRGVTVGLVFYSSIACLAWSKSKAGWIIALILVILVMARSTFNPRYKRWGLVVVLLVGIVGFALRFHSYFQQGATSVGARFDYWQAAVSTSISSPVIGTGPGTFRKAYSLVKKPESEMARLTHNDYLEQASDSGLPGFIAYLSFILGGLLHIYRYSVIKESHLAYAVVIGVTGWAIQGLVEFGLYIPALAWPVFTLFGWLIGQKSITYNDTVNVK